MKPFCPRCTAGGGRDPGGQGWEALATAGGGTPPGPGPSLPLAVSIGLSFLTSTLPRLKLCTKQKHRDGGLPHLWEFAGSLSFSPAGRDTPEGRASSLLL